MVVAVMVVMVVVVMMVMVVVVVVIMGMVMHTVVGSLVSSSPAARLTASAPSCDSKSAWLQARSFALVAPRLLDFSVSSPSAAESAPRPPALGCDGGGGDGGGGDGGSRGGGGRSSGGGDAHLTRLLGLVVTGGTLDSINIELRLQVGFGAVDARRIGVSIRHTDVARLLGLGAIVGGVGTEATGAGL